MALEAFEVVTDTYDDNAVGIEIDAIIALRKRLAQPKREWQGLTDDEIYECEKVGAIHYQRHKCSVRGQQLTPADDPQWHFAGAIEAKLKEKND